MTCNIMISNNYKKEVKGVKLTFNGGLACAEDGETRQLK